MLYPLMYVLWSSLLSVLALSMASLVLSGEGHRPRQSVMEPLRSNARTSSSVVVREKYSGSVQSGLRIDRSAGRVTNQRGSPALQQPASDPWFLRSPSSALLSRQMMMMD